MHCPLLSIVALCAAVAASDPPTNTNNGTANGTQPATSGYDYHNQAVCVSDITGGSPAGIENPNGWRGVVDANATECACNKYLARKTGVLQNDLCPDCRYDPATETCYSRHWHIGSVEFRSYCQHYCGGADWEGRG